MPPLHRRPATTQQVASQWRRWDDLRRRAVQARSRRRWEIRGATTCKRPRVRLFSSRPSGCKASALCSGRLNPSRSMSNCGFTATYRSTSGGRLMCKRVLPDGFARSMPTPRVISLAKVSPYSQSTARISWRRSRSTCWRRRIPSRCREVVSVGWRWAQLRSLVPRKRDYCNGRFPLQKFRS